VLRRVGEIDIEIGFQVPLLMCLVSLLSCVCLTHDYSIGQHIIVMLRSWHLQSYRNYHESNRSFARKNRLLVALDNNGTREEEKR
jgi:hypothetical protein